LLPTYNEGKFSVHDNGITWDQLNTGITNQQFTRSLSIKMETSFRSENKSINQPICLLLATTHHEFSGNCGQCYGNICQYSRKYLAGMKTQEYFGSTETEQHGAGAQQDKLQAILISCFNSSWKSFCPQQNSGIFFLDTTANLIG